MKTKLWILLLALFIVFPTLAQETSAPDSILSNETVQKEIQPILLAKSWQLNENILYEDLVVYPDSIAFKADVNKGVEFFSLSSDGSYSAILNGVSTNGFWLKNDKLIVFKQKAPLVVDVYYQITELSNTTLKLKNQNTILIFLSEEHPDHITLTASNSQIIDNEDFSISSILRGVLGMFVLLLIAFVFSSNKKSYKLEDSWYWASNSSLYCYRSIKNSFRAKRL